MLCKKNKYINFNFLELIPVILLEFFELYRMTGMSPYNLRLNCFA